MHDGLWQAVLGEIELSVSRGSYVTWFKNSRLLRYKDDVLIIGVANVFMKQQLEVRYSQLVTDTLAKNGVKPLRIEYKIHASVSNKPDAEEPILTNNPDSAGNPNNLSSSGNPNNESNRGRTGGTSRAGSPGNEKFHTGVGVAASGGTPQKHNPTSSLTHSYRHGLNDKYTFDNFIVGSGNELAYAACQAIANSPGNKYNPLFLYGGVGIGKTHLIQAVGNAVVAKNPSSHIVYVTSEQFIQEFLDAIRYKKNTDFAGYYRSADVLIVDDMQFIAGKEKTQEEFFHTFNALHQANKQIIISSDKPPRDIPTLEDRLKSRFTWGMSIDMQIPDFETRCAIIQTKAGAHDITLEPEVVDYLAQLVQNNIRELEGALNHLLASCEMRGIVPDLAVATQLLGNTKTRPKHISAKQIVERTAKHFQIGMDEILGPKRDRDIVVPRQVAMYILRSELHLSFPKIARELGRKDHTTAIHSVEKIEKEVSFDADIRAAVSEIRDRLYA